MCGIIGYVGYREAEPVLVEGLRRLEYRGYASAGVATLTGLQAMPELIRRTLDCHERVKHIAEKYAHVKNNLYLGRQYLFPLALEGALKLKEISYIHAEGYPAAEMKHGPIDLVDEETPTIFSSRAGAFTTRC